MAEDDKEVLAPVNFSMVEGGVYRSAFPRTKNTDFLKRLHLKTVISLVPEEYPVAMAEFYRDNGIQLVSHGLDGNKWPFKEIDVEGMKRVLSDVLDVKKRPLLIHCNKGKHRTGSVVGCLRKLRGWALSVIFTEYMLFAEPKPRLEDQQFIEAFNLSEVEILSLADRNQLQRQKMLAFATTQSDAANTIDIAHPSPYDSELSRNEYGEEIKAGEDERVLEEVAGMNQ